MARACTSCQHLRRPEIDRRLAEGERLTKLAQDYGLNASSLHRHRKNCLKLGSANDIKKEQARGSAAVALLPSKETLSGAFLDLCRQTDEIVADAKREGSYRIAISGLNAIRQTLNSLVRLAGHDRPAEAAPDAVVTNRLDTAAIAARLIEKFDHEPELKARIAAALLEIDEPPAPTSTAADNAPAAAAAVAAPSGPKDSAIGAAMLATQTIAAPRSPDPSATATAPPPAEAQKFPTKSAAVTGPSPIRSTDAQPSSEPTAAVKSL